MTIAEFTVPPMRAVLPVGTADEFNEWINDQVIRLLADHEAVVIIYSDGQRDTVMLDADGVLVTAPHEESPESLPEAQGIEVDDFAESA